MRLIARRGMEPIVIDQISEILVLGDDGTPLSLAVQHRPDWHTLKHVGEGQAAFKQALAANGLDRLEVRAERIDKPRILLP